MRGRGNWFICGFLFALFRSGPKVIDSSREQMRTHLSSTRAVVTWPKERRVLTKNGYTADGRKKFRVHSSTCIKDRDSVVQRTCHSFAVVFHLVISLLTSLTRDETPGPGGSKAV